MTASFSGHTTGPGVSTFRVGSRSSKSGVSSLRHQFPSQSETEETLALKKIIAKRRSKYLKDDAFKTLSQRVESSQRFRELTDDQKEIARKLLSGLHTASANQLLEAAQKAVQFKFDIDMRLAISLALFEATATYEVWPWIFKHHDGQILISFKVNSEMVEIRVDKTTISDNQIEMQLQTVSSLITERLAS